MTKRIAIIGSGISGLVSANLLCKRYEVALFEANSYLGGHTHTLDVNLEGSEYTIDTGFIVFNKKTYPHFCKLLSKHNIAIKPSEMSFSYRSDEHQIEYNSRSLNTLFCDRRNLIRPMFYRFITDILRFNKDAKRFLQSNLIDMSIEEFIHVNKYSNTFVKGYLVPMIAAIWSKKQSAVLRNSARFIFQFYEKHGLLSTYNQPKWYVIAGGARNYISYLVKGFSKQIMLNTKIERIERTQNQVILKSNTDQFTFDAVVIATHSDQALAMLAKPSESEIEVLSAIPYSENEITLHTDTQILPTKNLGWASWNFLDKGDDSPTLTYYMNRLQSLKGPHHICISVNLSQELDKNKIIKQFTYSHPIFNEQTHTIQRKHSLLNGKNNTYYAGAYWGYGFHEDGVRSALDACAPLGIENDPIATL